MSSYKQTEKLSDNGIARLLAITAIRQLRRSEGGKQALFDFMTMIDNGGYSLDGENWYALRMLCRLGEAGKVFAIDEQICTRRRR